MIVKTLLYEVLKCVLVTRLTSGRSPKRWKKREKKSDEDEGVSSSNDNQHDGALTRNYRHHWEPVKGCQGASDALWVR